MVLPARELMTLNGREEEEEEDREGEREEAGERGHLTLQILLLSAVSVPHSESKTCGFTLFPHCTR